MLFKLRINWLHWEKVFQIRIGFFFRIKTWDSNRFKIAWCDLNKWRTSRAEQNWSQAAKETKICRMLVHLYTDDLFSTVLSILKDIFFYCFILNSGITMCLKLRKNIVDYQYTSSSISNFPNSLCTIKFGASSGTYHVVELNFSLQSLEIRQNTRLQDVSCYTFPHRVFNMIVS